MDNLPDELIRKIIKLTNLCKKDQNFYVNKRFLKLSKEKFIKCQKKIIFKHNICVGCHPQVLTFFKGYYSSID